MWLRVIWAAMVDGENSEEDEGEEAHTDGSRELDENKKKKKKAISDSESEISDDPIPPGRRRRGMRKRPATTLVSDEGKNK